jgi:hypothetical protein
MKPQISKRLLSLTLLLLLGGGCGYDHGLDPVPYRIKGAITFLDRPPDWWYIREVRIAAVKKFPLEDLTSDLIFSDPLIFTRDTTILEQTIPFELAATPGTYPLVGILWRQADKTWDVANILGLYGVALTRGEFSFKEVVISEERPVADSVNIEAYWPFAVRRNANLSGNITFEGQWPADTDFLIVGSYLNTPKNTFEFFTEILAGKALFQIIFQRTPLASYQYNLGVNSELESGEYKFLALFWKGKTGGVLDMHVIGLYHCSDPDDPLLPKVVKAFTDSTVTGLDFKADFRFAAVPIGIPYCKENCPPCNK